MDTEAPAARWVSGEAGKNPMEGGEAQAEPTCRFSETLKSSTRDDGSQDSSHQLKPMRGATRKRGARPAGSIPRRGETPREGARAVRANHARQSQRIQPMPKSSKPTRRKPGNDTEDTASREAPGATVGEKPSEGGKPKDGTGTKQGQKSSTRSKASRRRETSRTLQSQVRQTW